MSPRMHPLEVIGMADVLGRAVRQAALEGTAVVLDRHTARAARDMLEEYGCEMKRRQDREDKARAEVRP